MLIKARYARLANAQAPRQEKAAQAAAWLRNYFGPSMRLWLDGQHDQYPFGIAVNASYDRSGKSVSVAQGTAARRPMRSMVNGVAGWTFDGTDDRLEAGAIDLSGSAKATVIVVNRLAVAAAGILFEVAENSGVFQGGIQTYRNAASGFEANSHSGANFNDRKITSTTGTWYCHGVTIDRSLAAASETVPYENGSAPASTAVVLAELSANFENRSGMIGGWSFSSLTLNGQIGQVAVFIGAFTDSQMYNASRLLMQLSGIA